MNKALLLAVVLLGAFGAASVASANHSWGSYHWARTASPFTLKLGDNATAAWDAYLAQASSEWSATPEAGVAKVINTTIVPGGTTARTCKAVAGTVQVCNNKYGGTGWLGLAQIWINGSHISQGVAKMNDTYFNTTKYNTPAWRRLVMCQEIAHTFGLGHVNEAFGNANTGSCMDYTNAPAGGIVGGFDYGLSNEAPNAHDFEQLASIYAHLDSTNSYSTTAVVSARGGVAPQARMADYTNASEWGRAVGRDESGRESRFERTLADGSTLQTHVFWIPEEEGEHDHDSHEH